jgi:hypothetical protein
MIAMMLQIDPLGKIKVDQNVFPFRFQSFIDSAFLSEWLNCVNSDGHNATLFEFFM